MLCVPGNHDLADGSGEVPLDTRLLAAYGQAFGPDRWVVSCGGWTLLGINAQLLGTDSPQEFALWRWIEGQACRRGTHAHTAVFLHRPVLRPQPGEMTRKGRYVATKACNRLLNGPLRPTPRMVVRATRTSTSTSSPTACAIFGCRRPRLFCRTTCRLGSAKSSLASACSTSATDLLASTSGVMTAWRGTTSPRCSTSGQRAARPPAPLGNKQTTAQSPCTAVRTEPPQAASSAGPLNGNARLSRSRRRKISWTLRMAKMWRNLVTCAP